LPSGKRHLALTAKDFAIWQAAPGINRNQILPFGERDPALTANHFAIWQAAPGINRKRFCHSASGTRH